ncbi:MAG TPA: cell division protein ZapA [Holophagaceae bacterium]|nr:cell division protein ZapA [Holophagaceae bacterium]
MKAKGKGPAPSAPREVELQVLGHHLRILTDEPEEALDSAVATLERTFEAMEEASRVKWGHARAATDTPSWLLLGALNLAHQLSRREREANQHTQDLEQTLSKLLQDVPDDIPAPPSGLFGGGLSS